MHLSASVPSATLQLLTPLLYYAPAPKSFGLGLRPLNSGQAPAQASNPCLTPRPPYRGCTSDEAKSSRYRNQKKTEESNIIASNRTSTNQQRLLSTPKTLSGGFQKKRTSHRQAKRQHIVASNEDLSQVPSKTSVDPLLALRRSVRSVGSGG